MKLRIWAPLLIVFALASVADAQTAKSNIQAKARQSANVATNAHAMQTVPALQPVTQTPPAEQKPEGEVPRITVEELKAKLAKNAPVFIIDSRSPGSYDNSEIKIKGAVRIPMDEIESRLSEIPRDREIVVYCT